MALLLRRAPPRLGVLARRLCLPAGTAWGVLGLQPGTPTPLIKQRFYELAKATHPDVATADTDDGAPSARGHSFVEVLAAFEALMDDDGVHTARTAPNAAARGGHAGPARRRAGGGSGGAGVQRERSLGEILCDRLIDEPWAVRDVWNDIVTQQLELRDSMLDALFRACGARSGGGGLHVALEILRDARRRSLLPRTTARTEAAVISIIKWCKEDSTSFARIVAELDESE